ncbi:MAG: hypothetical protein KAJ40_06255, partial [Alphaproteobacteria bacterium]|nr:hypothetical protein [Alphaproteobacteria bacterium]
MFEISGKQSAQLSPTTSNLEDTPLEPTPDIQALWTNVHSDMREEFGEAVFRSWLKPLTLQACYHGSLEVSVPTRFMRDWIQTHYAQRISAMCSEKNSEIRRVQIVVVQNAIMDDMFSSQDKRQVPSGVREQENLRAAIAEISS